MPLLPVEFSSRGQRDRLLAGALEAVVDRGYPATNVAHIIAAAGVSRTTFYECFASKEECVLATYDLIVDWLAARISGALAGVEEWVDAVSVVVEAVLVTLDADQRMACFCAVEILCLGRVGLARYEASIERLAMLLRAGRAFCPWGSRLPLGLEQTTVGGAVWLVCRRASPEGSIRLAGLTSDIVYFLLAPYLDPGPARRAAAAIGMPTDALSPGPPGAAA